MSVFKGIKISNNKLKPLKGNVVRVDTTVSAKSIDHLVSLGALVIRVVPDTTKETVDSILEATLNTK